jgi:hypothetical protein
MVLLQKKKEKGEKISDFPTLGFTYQLVNGEERPQCVVCGEVLANNSFNARYLPRHKI